MNLTKQQLAELENDSGKIIVEIGTYILKQWSQVSIVSFVDRRDITTNVDIEAQEQLKERLGKLFPEAGFLLEEGKSSLKKNFNWIIDPLDGTKDYFHHSPFFYSQFALQYREEPILGHIYNPLSKQLFSASKGNKTKLNGKICVLNPALTPEKAIIDIDEFTNLDTREYGLNIFTELHKKFYRIRMSGGRFIPYILTGNIDVYLKFDLHNKYVDVAARIILLKEAGLIVKTLNYQGKKILIATNKKLLPVIESCIKSVIPIE